MYTFQQISIRPIEEQDLEILRSLRNDMSTQMQLGSIGMETRQSQHDWWKNGLITEKNQRFAIIQTRVKKVIGIARILNIDLCNQNCEVGIDILPNKRRKGWGQQSYICLLNYLFSHKNMNMVYLKVIDFNKNAQSLYQKVGFRNTGYFKNFIYRFGKYWNYNIMCIEKKTYKNIHKF